MIDFIDTSTPIDGVNYTNNPFNDCSINALQLTEYLQPVSPDLKSPVRSCQFSDPLTPGYCWLQYDFWEVPLLSDHQ